VRKKNLIAVESLPLPVRELPEAGCFVVARDPSGQSYLPKIEKKRVPVVAIFMDDSLGL
jgi:hypothetical protein